ncbi:hypothetical protein KAU33_16185 [Candidatus Dependentiae bacterium]|nr:hypothetical protein [Candidatus Dependentiae bacterium]
MAPISVKCEMCGDSVLIYPEDNRIYESGQEIGHNGCMRCGSRVEATLSINVSKRKEGEERQYNV